jgi:HK97 family phage major capsid protein
MPVNMIERLDTSALSDEQVYAEVIKGITEGSTVLPLMTRLPDLTKKQGKLAVLSALPQAYFVSGDTGIKQTTKAAWENVYITSEELAVIIPISEAVLDDVDYDIWAAVRQPLIDVFYQKIDRAILHSDNRPSSWPIGVATQAAATGHQVAETAELYQDLLGVGGVLNLIEADGYSANGAVAQTGFKAKMRGLVDANKQPIFRSAYSNGNAGSMVYELDGNPIHFPANGSMATGDPLAVFGDFKQAVFAMRKELTFKLFTEGVVTDNDNNIVYNLMQNDMVALRAVMRLGWAMPNPTNMLNGVKATRFPFSILVANDSATAGGRYITTATLPSTGVVNVMYILSDAIIGTGTAAAPQYKKGDVLKYTGGAWVVIGNTTV